MSPLALAEKKALSASRLFNDLGAQTVADLSKMAQRRKLQRGQLLFMAGAPVEQFYFILSGKIKEYYIGNGGEECIIRVSHPGEFLGLPALFLSEGNHTSYAEAVGSLQVAVFRVPPFLELLERETALNRNLLTLLSYRLECTRQQRCFCQKMSAECRVANYLLNQSDNRFHDSCHHCGCCPTPVVNLQPLNLSAQEVGLARETFTRILKRFKQEGIIAMQRGQVEFLNRQAIEQLAQPET